MSRFEAFSKHTFLLLHATHNPPATLWLPSLQLREFYGPLLACVTATASGYQGMVKQHSPDGTRKGLSKAIQTNPDGPEAQAYRSALQVPLPRHP